MDAGTGQQDPQGRDLASFHHNGKPPASGQSPLRNGLAQAWRWALTPVANYLNRWQRRVGFRTRNGILLLLLAGVFMYASFLLISLFI
jgi:hypothetical protein